MSKRKTTEQFIADARAVHGDKYDYSKVVYTNNHTKVEIICPIHGSFWQLPSNHIRLKHNCPRCVGNEKLTINQFIEKGKKKHNNKFDYSKAIYINGVTKVEIICPIHGSFWQLPSNHLKYDCRKCTGKDKKDTKWFVGICEKKHNNKYDYNKTTYIDAQKKVEVVCQRHGSFWIKPSHHIGGVGCAKCSAEKTTSQNEITLRKLIISDYPFLTLVPNYREHPALNGNEIDIWLPDIGLGIEWNGIYWHSFRQAKMNDEIKKQVLGENLIQVVDKGNANAKFVISTYEAIVKPEIQKRVSMEHLFS